MQYFYPQKEQNTCIYRKKAVILHRLIINFFDRMSRFNSYALCVGAVLTLLLGACRSTDTRDITPCSGRVECLSLYSPQLQKQMQVDVWLPETYDQGDACFPVLYAHDGQNLLDSTHTWMHQEWQVDEAITRMADDSILPPIAVCIYNDEDRFRDYMPANLYTYLSEEQRREGLNLEGLPVPEPRSKAYIDFIICTLKPHIDSLYRTLPDREHTAMMGSSMGALVSVYAAAYRPDVFGCCMGLSFPAIAEIWDIQRQALQENTDVRTRLYIDTGDAGLDATFFPQFNEIEPLLHTCGYDSTTLMVRVFPGADHNETCWAQRVDIPLRFAFFQ